VITKYSRENPLAKSRVFFQPELLYPTGPEIVVHGQPRYAMRPAGTLTPYGVEQLIAHARVCGCENPFCGELPLDRSA
jgi:hypothetical protein